MILTQKEYDKIKSLTIGELREAILDNMISGDEILKKARGMTSEVIAALAKLMGNLDLMYVSRKLHIEATCNTTIGKKGTFAVRLQPNHPTDNVKGVTASLLEGLSYGAGDAVLGLNPAIDNVKSTTDILNLFNDVKSRLKNTHSNMRLEPYHDTIKGFKKRSTHGSLFSVNRRKRKSSSLLSEQMLTCSRKRTN